MPAGAASWGHMVWDESQRLWEMVITEHESPSMGHLITIPLASSLASTSTFFPEDHPKLLRLLVLWYGSQILTSLEEGISVDFPAVSMPQISLQPGRKADPIVPDVAEKSNSEQKGMFPQRMMWLL